MLEKTNEERRVEFYNDDAPPTVAAAVTPETPLADLNLNWREKDLPQKQRTKHVHSLHPYLGKFVPQLAEIFLRKYFQPGQTVYDPFSGSGTTLVQANELGIHAIGSDISAFNALLGRVKTGTYDLHTLAHEVEDILARTRKQTAKPASDVSDLPLFADTDTPAFTYQTGNDYLDAWFAPRALYELVTYRDLIDSGDYTYTNLLKIILSRSARSARLTPTTTWTSQKRRKPSHITVTSTRAPAPRFKRRTSSSNAIARTHSGGCGHLPTYAPMPKSTYTMQTAARSTCRRLMALSPARPMSG